LLILHGTADKATKFAGSRAFHDAAGSADKTLKLYEGHHHDLLLDVDKEIVMVDIESWNDARLALARTMELNEWGSCASDVTG